MSEEKQISDNRSVTPDLVVRTLLTKAGDFVDRLTGRGWKPASSLATSGLTEKLKALLDAEVVEEKDGRKYVPHNLKLKMQWDKFATDSEDDLRKLEAEFLIAAIDHINDKRYYTYAPLSIEVKPDYFTSGVKLFASFDEPGQEKSEAELTVETSTLSETNSSYDNSASGSAEPESEAPLTRSLMLTAAFNINGKMVEKKLELKPGLRLSVGRTKENDLAIDDISVSKYHASLLWDGENDLLVADTGSTNGTFINGIRIAYGKAVNISLTDQLKFGTVGVKFSPPQNVGNNIDVQKEQKNIAVPPSVQDQDAAKEVTKIEAVNSEDGNDPVPLPTERSIP